MIKEEWREILQEVEALCSMHEKITNSSGCREFNRRSALLLQRLEDSDCHQMADRAMDLLASCNPKDLSQCDSVQRTKALLERIRAAVEEELEKVNA